jgi:LysM repeat protein
MKKMAETLVVILALTGMFSCASTGNTTGSVTAPPAAEDRALAQIYDRYESTIVLTGAQTYTVAKGDTLSHIAREYYGTGDNPYYFPLIIAASKGSADIVDPDKIEVGMRLTIPSVQENLSNPAARDNLKNLLKDIAEFYAAKPGAQSAGIHNGVTRLYNAL